MKKSILALAVLGAFAGVASAQSSVTLYGRAEVNATYTEPGTGDKTWNLFDGGRNSGIGGSRWGVRGTEDLGGGTRAYFVVESGFELDSGAQSSTSSFFNRQAYVALGSTSLGDIRLGRQETISRLINSGFSDASAIGELKIDEAVLGGRQLFQTQGQRQNNVVNYLTPVFGGFQVSGQIGAGEGSSARYQGIMGSYVAGPLKIALGYEAYDAFDSTDPAVVGARTSSFNEVVNVGGNYNFGFATLFLGYQDSTDVGGGSGAAITTTGVRDQQAWNAGVMVPVGKFQIRGQYTNVDYDLNNGTSADQQKYGLSVRYLLSKRTTLYSAYTERAGETGGFSTEGGFGARREFTLLGVAHTF